MEQAGQVDVISYNTYLKVLLNEGLRDDVAAVLKDMQSRGLKPNAVTYNSLIKDVVARQDLQGAWRLIDACVRLRNVQRLTQVLEQFKATGVVPSLHACATLIRAYGHARRLDRAWVLWRELTEERKVTPTEEVFASMVDACLANGDLDE